MNEPRAKEKQEFHEHQLSQRIKSSIAAPTCAAVSHWCRAHGRSLQMSRTCLALLVGGLLLALTGCGREDIAKIESAKAEAEARAARAEAEAIVPRIQGLIRNRKNPRVELESIKVVQSGEDVLINGKGRNSGDCILASLQFRAQVGKEVDGILVRVKDKPAFEVAIGDEFTFELYFYYTSKPAQIRIWFALDDLKDDRFENDPVVSVRQGKAEPKEFLLIR